VARPSGGHEPDPILSAPVGGPASLVELVDWPDHDRRRVALAAAGRPRLLLVAPDAPPPICVDPLEDWVRLPADPVDVDHRRALLAHRAGRHPDVPVLDVDGVLRRGRHLAILPPVEARLAEALLAQAGRVVARERLLAAGWPERRFAGPTDDGRALDGRIKLLRRRLAPLGLEVHTVRGVGFLLHL
jgi:hypothetical protein